MKSVKCRGQNQALWYGISVPKIQQVPCCRASRSLVGTTFWSPWLFTPVLMRVTSSGEDFAWRSFALIFMQRSFSEVAKPNLLFDSSFGLFLIRGFSPFLAGQHFLTAQRSIPSLSSHRRFCSNEWLLGFLAGSWLGPPGTQSRGPFPGGTRLYCHPLAATASAWCSETRTRCLDASFPNVVI